MSKLETRVHGMNEEEYNILVWAGAKIVPVYDKGSKSAGTRKALYHHIYYPTETVIVCDKTVQETNGLLVRGPDRILLPGEYPVIMIQWATDPKDKNFVDYPYYRVDVEYSSEYALDWYYRPQCCGDEFKVNASAELWKDRFFLCNCCHEKTFFPRGWNYKLHNHHPNCIFLKERSYQR